MLENKGPEPADYLTAAKILLLREFPDEQGLVLLPHFLFNSIAPLVPVEKHNELAGAICAAIEQSI